MEVLHIGVDTQFEREGPGIWTGTVAFEPNVPGEEGSATLPRAVREESRRWQRRALSAKGEAHSSDSIATISELARGEGRASRSERMAESHWTNGVLWGSFGTRGRISGVLCVTVRDCSEVAGAVPIARPAGGDTVRTSVSEDEVGEDGSLDILKTELRSSLCEGKDQPRKFLNRT